jgi:hypothetical protein
MSIVPAGVEDAGQILAALAGIRERWMALDYRFVADQPGGRCRIAHMDDRLQRADLLRRDSPRA